MELVSDDSGMKREVVGDMQVVDRDADPALEGRRGADHARPDKPRSA